MKFLDSNGLNHFLTKIKASFGRAMVNSSDYKTEIDNEGHINIPFIANHQIVQTDYGQPINVYNWFRGASRGGILEITPAAAVGCRTYCRSENGDNYIYRAILSASVPILYNFNSIITSYDSYLRLIKADDNHLMVALYFQIQ